uniref:BHLH domain-containing protein n=1 Tax=Parastrongyloides trichosuri TaxID=131310 RepID=A0A0N4Z7E7_PARTI
MNNTGGGSQNIDKKKETHLRCERQRREAINNGYNELRELLPKSMSSLGCKTTNASILFRSSDYIQQLTTKLENQEDELSKLRSKYAALQMIASEYENLSMESASQLEESRDQQALVKLLEMAFDSFKRDVDTSDYEKLTKTLLAWVEKLDYKSISIETLTHLYTNP